MTARYLTVAGAAEYLSLTEDGVRWLVRTDDIPHFKVGRRLRFDIQDLDLWMRRHRIEAS